MSCYEGELKHGHGHQAVLAALVVSLARSAQLLTEQNGQSQAASRLQREMTCTQSLQYAPITSIIAPTFTSTLQTTRQGLTGATMPTCSGSDTSAAQSSHLKICSLKNIKSYHKLDEVGKVCFATELHKALVKSDQIYRVHKQRHDLKPNVLIIGIGCMTSNSACCSLWCKHALASNYSPRPHTPRNV